MNLFKLWLLTIQLMLVPGLAAGATLKIAALVPPGTTWAKSLQKMKKEIKEATEGRVKLKLYLGGVAGDEPDVLRKIRIGQLHGGVFTGKTLGDIHGDSRILEVPFNFLDSRQKALGALDALEKDISTGLNKKGFTNLGYFELGQVYLVARKKVQNLDGLKGIKIWAWEGDKLVRAMLENLQLVSVPLALPDVMNSLATGMIDAAYSSPLGILALQWQSKISYLIDFPISYGFAGLLIQNKRWKKISEKDQQKITEIAAKIVKETNEKTNQENKEALLALKQSGVEFIKFPKTDTDKVTVIRQQVLKKLTGDLLSPEMISKYQKLAP